MGVDQSVGLARIGSPVGEEDAGLFEALPQGRHPEGEASGLDAQHGTGLGVAALRTGFLGGRGAVLVVDLPTGKDIGTPHEVRIEVALEHAHLEGGRPVEHRIAHEHDGGGVSRRHRAHRLVRGCSGQRHEGQATEADRLSADPDAGWGVTRLATPRSGRGVGSGTRPSRRALDNGDDAAQRHRR